MQVETLRQRIKRFLVEHDCKPEKTSFYSWYIAPNGHKFSVDSCKDDLFIINHRDSAGKNRDFIEPLSAKNLETVAKGFILWMLFED